MAGTLPIGHWSWHERWLYPDQIRDMPDRPLQYVAAQHAFQVAAQKAAAAQQQAAHAQAAQHYAAALAGQAQVQPAQPYTHTQQVFQPVPPAELRLRVDMMPKHLQPTQQQLQHMHEEKQHQQQQYNATQQQQATNGSNNGFSLNLAPLLHSGGGSGSGSTNNPQAAQNNAFPSLPRRYRDGTFKRTTSEYATTYREPAGLAAELACSASARHGGSMYNGSQSARSGNGDDVGAVPGSRLPLRERGKLHAPKDFLHHHASTHWAESDEDKARVRPEQHSFRLWGRLNTAHCVLPYETESQRAFQLDHLAAADRLDTRHNLTVERKDYKEALAKAKFTKVIRGDGSYAKKG